MTKQDASVSTQSAYRSAARTSAAVAVAAALTLTVGSCTIFRESPQPQDAAPVPADAAPVPPEVAPAPAEVVLSPDSVSLRASGPTLRTRRLSALVLDANGNAVTGAQIRWTTADETVATVDPLGLVRSVREGNTVVVATSGGVSGTAQVVVTSAPQDTDAPQESAATPAERAPRATSARQERRTRSCWGMVPIPSWTGTDCAELFASSETSEMSPNVQSVTRVTSFSDGRGQVGRPVVSATGDLYYAYADDAATPEADLWRQPIVGTGRTRVTMAPGRDIEPILADRGTALIFSSSRAGGWALWRINAQGGSGLTRITEPADWTGRASISPDQALIAYSATNSNQRHSIWTLDRRTGEHKQLGLGVNPTISPDGTKIMYNRLNPSTEKWEIWHMDMAGGGETFISGGSDRHELDPVWSPSGNSILYASNQGTYSDGKHNFDIWHMALGRGMRTQLTTNASHDDKPLWHADDRIFFRSNRGGAWNIWYMRTTGGLVR